MDENTSSGDPPETYLYCLTRNLVCPTSIISYTADGSGQVSILGPEICLAYEKWSCISTQWVAMHVHAATALLSSDSRAASSSACSSIKSASFPRSMLRCMPGAFRPQTVSKAIWAASTAISTSLTVASETEVVTNPFADDRAGQDGILRSGQVALLTRVDDAVQLRSVRYRKIVALKGPYSMVV